MTRYTGPMPDGWVPKGPRQPLLIADLVDLYRQHDESRAYPGGRGPRGAFYDLRPEGPSGIRYVKTKDLPIDPATGRPYLAGVNPDGTIYADQVAVGEALTYARRAGLIPERLIADTRTGSQHTLYWDTDADNEVDTRIWRLLRAPDLQLNPQQFEDTRVELWVEAQDFAARAAQLVRPFGVEVYSGSGSTSLKLVRDTAQRLAYQRVPTTVLQIGDCDKYGRSISAHFENDVRAWLTATYDQGGYDKPADWLAVERLALTEEQAQLWDLLDADGNGEADGIPLDELDNLVRDGCQRYLTREARERWLAAQERERERVPALLADALADIDLDEMEQPSPVVDQLFNGEVR
jgi:hypothetical protein